MKSKSKPLTAAQKRQGWREGSTQEFLGLSDDEAEMAEIRGALLALFTHLQEERGVSQTELAKMLGSSQSRVSKIAAGDPTVSLNLIVKAIVALGGTRRQVGEVLLKSA
jgi:predicted XRE-type DNA-binding protein